MIKDRKEATLGVHHEIRHGHFAARNESRNPSKQPDGNHEATHQFDDSADIHDSRTRAVTAGWNSQKFLTAVTSEEKADDQSHQAINRARKKRQRVHVGRLFGRSEDVKGCYFSCCHSEGSASLSS